MPWDNLAHTHIYVMCLLGIYSFASSPIVLSGCVSRTRSSCHVLRFSFRPIASYCPIFLAVQHRKYMPGFYRVGQLNPLLPSSRIFAPTTSARGPMGNVGLFSVLFSFRGAFIVRRLKRSDYFVCGSSFLVFSYLRCRFKFSFITLQQS